MAAFDNLTDPFGSPEATSQPQQPDLASQWSKFLDDPRSKSALMNFGLSLMQPAPWGASPVATAFGAVGEGLRTQDEAAQKQQAIDTKETAAQSANDRRVAQTTQGETALGIKQNQFQLNQQRQNASEADRARLREYQADTLQLKRDLADAKAAGDVTKADALQRRLDMAEQRTQAIVGRLELDRQNADVRNLESGARVDNMTAGQINRLQIRYDTQKRLHDEAQILKPRGQRSEFPDFQSWRAANPQLDQATPGLDRARVPAANAPQPAVDPELDMSNLPDGFKTPIAERVMGRSYQLNGNPARWGKDPKTGKIGWIPY